MINFGNLWESYILILMVPMQYVDSKLDFWSFYFYFLKPDLEAFLRISIFLSNFWRAFENLSRKLNVENLTLPHNEWMIDR